VQERAFLGSHFEVDKVYRLCILEMTDYSISEAARQLGIQRRTLYKWIREKRVPAPTTRVVAGTRIRFWTEKGMAKLRQFKAERFWGRGNSRKDKQNSKVKYG
jgi:excisionase family DNA binding protein